MCKDVSKSPMGERFKKRITRRKMPGGTSGVDYDQKKLKDQKTLAMEQWEGVPGFGGADDFTWHHVVPQSKINDKAFAANELMVRLGPSVEKRVGDPGNEYADYNFNDQGAMTPFSEDVEELFEQNKGRELDAAELTEKLKELARQHESSGSGGSTDPKTWFIPTANLTAILPKQGPVADMKKVITKFEKDIRYVSTEGQGDEIRDTKAVCVFDLREVAIKTVINSEADAKRVFTAFSNMLKGKNDMFVRAFKANPLEIAISTSRDKVTKAVRATFDARINVHPGITSAIGLLEAKVAHVSGLVVARKLVEKDLHSLVVFEQPDNTVFFPGNVPLDFAGLTELNAACTALQGRSSITHEASQLKGFDTPKRAANAAELAQLHELLGSDAEPDEDEMQQAQEQANADAAQQVKAMGYTLVKDLKQFWNPLKGMDKRKKASAFIVSAAEKDQHIKVTSKADFDAAHAFADNVRAERGGDLDAFKNTQAQQIAAGFFDAAKAAALKAAKAAEGKARLSDFQKGQDTKTRQANADIKAFLDLYGTDLKPSGAPGPAVDILAKHWKKQLKDAKTRLDNAFNITICDIEPKSEADLENYEATLKTQLDQIVDNAVDTIAVAISKA